MQDSTDRLETPERVDLEVEYAAIGSRALAHLIDLVILLAGGLVVGAILLALAPVLGSWSAIVAVALGLFAFSGYFTLFEWRWQGQTPGKRLVRLRVQRLGGYPIGATEAVLRNLLRPIDALLAYAVGLASMLATARNQRLGDLVAGTVVVHESAGGVGDLAAIGYASSARPERALLSTREYETLHEFLTRRPQLEVDAVARMQDVLASTLSANLRARGRFDARWTGLAAADLLREIDAAHRGVERDASAPY